MNSIPQYIAILGRQPRLGLAELESRVGADVLTPLNDQAVLVHAALTPNQLGGTIKLAEPLSDLPTTDWPTLVRAVGARLPELVQALPEGKIRLALGCYGLQVSSQQLFRAGLELKKLARSTGRNVRVVPPGTSSAPNSAQTLHNQLTGDTGLELLLIAQAGKTWLAKTVWVQQIDEYSRRDFGRPKRDAFVGMLPPKLAQQMLNLAQAKSGQVVLDPFCGTGVMLQEAMLNGCLPYGTDLEPKMIDYTRQNLDWLASTYHLPSRLVMLEVADATTHPWRQAPIDHVVSEVYLGQPLSGLPSPQKLDEIIKTCNIITAKFLTNLRSQLQSGSRHCLAVPAWRVPNGFRHLPVIDRLSSLGYNRVRFQHATERDLVYHRTDQIVGRELLVLTIA